MVMLSEFSPIEPAQSISARIRSRLCASLMAGEFRPGDKLILRTLAKQFEVSLTPVREALFNLVSEGVLAVGRNGTIVVPMMSVADIKELAGVRAALEGLAVRAAYPNLSAGDLAALKRINAKIVSAVDDMNVRKVVELNWQFHFRIYEAAKSPFLLRLIESCWLRSGSYVAGIYHDAESMRMTASNHDEILAQLENGTEDGAVDALCRDLEHASQGFLVLANRVAY
jgi:DNA-binding GntR family transcriptional regulator